MSYLNKKSKFLKDKTVNPDINLGIETAERLLESEVREIVGPYAQLVKKLSILIDTKKPDTRNQIFKWLLENQETIKMLNQNVDKLINITRI